MITLILMLSLQIGSQHGTVIQASDQCGSSPDVVYDTDTGWLCVPSDLISKQGFENE